MLKLTKFLRAIALFAFMVLFCSSVSAQTADVTFTIGTTTTPLQSLLGVNAGPLHWNGHTSNKDLFTEYAQIGVKAVRNHDFPDVVDMSVMYPDRTKDTTLQTSYNFTRPGISGDYSSDYAVSNLQSNGLQLYLRIWGLGATPTLISSERANWVKAAVEIIRHYQEGKWSGYTGLVNTVEIGNEPDSSYFWPSTYTKEEFYQLYADTAKAIRAAFPTMKIGGPGITQGGFSNTIGQTWVRNFFDYVKTNGAPLDFFSWHLYSNSPDQFATAASFYRSELDSRGYTATELHTTEWNTQIDLSVNPPPSSVQATNLEYRTKAKGAALMTATWMTLHQSGIKQSYFYRGNNNDANDYQNYGLFAVDGTPRKTALAFGLWSEFTNYQNRIDPTASANISGLKAMAAQRSDGQIAILVANTGTSSRNWTAAFTDTRSLSNYSLTLRTVDDNSATTTTSVPAGTVFTIAPDTVQLLLATTNVVTNPYTGLWWNSNESGWGMSLTQHGSTIANAMYTYDQTGQPTWYTMACPLTGVSCTGDIYKVSGGTPPTVPWNGSGKVTSSAGSGTLTFADANTGTFIYTINDLPGSKSVSRLVFATGTTPPAVDYTDLWWNQNESGWGVALTQQYGIASAAWYSYDSTGKAVWYVGTCTVSGSGCTTSDLYQFTGGAPLTSVWHGTNPSTKVGTISFAFTDASNGTMSYTINGVARSRVISRLAF